MCSAEIGNQPYSHKQISREREQRNNAGAANRTDNPCDPTPGADEASSFIARVENNPDDYPTLIKMQAGNDLKITNNSFKQALGQLSQHECL